VTRRSIILVVCGALAVLVGVAVAVIGQSDRESAASEATAPVLVATGAIAPGTEGATASGLVSVQMVKVDDRSPGAFTDPTQLVGRTFTSEVASGSQVVAGDLDAPALRETAIEVPEGTEAVAIEVPFVPGAAGYASPGDVVNVFALLDAVDPALLDPEADPEAAARATQTGTVGILSNVTVLDVSVEVAPRVAARTDAVAATSSTTTTAPGAKATAPTQITYLLAVPVGQVADLVQAAGFHRLYVSIPAEGTAARPETAVTDADLIGAGA
jgi:Flp pilus assembly protein CpaB